jgi:hypothetical protein
MFLQIRGGGVTSASRSESYSSRQLSYTYVDGNIAVKAKGFLLALGDVLCLIVDVLYRVYKEKMSEG